MQMLRQIPPVPVTSDDAASLQQHLGKLKRHEDQQCCICILRKRLAELTVSASLMLQIVPSLSLYKLHQHRIRQAEVIHIINDREQSTIAVHR